MDDILQNDLLVNQKQNIWRVLNDERTGFWWSVFYIFFESLAPGIIIWILISNDFIISLNSNLPAPLFLYVSLICLSYLMYTWLSTYLFYKLKLHKADNFTYSLSFTHIFITITLLSFAFGNTTVFIIIKFIIVIIIIVISITFGVFITTILLEKETKKEKLFLNDYNLWLEGFDVEKTKLKKIKRFHQEKLEKEARAEYLKNFKKNIFNKIDKQISSKKTDSELNNHSNTKKSTKLETKISYDD